MSREDSDQLWPLVPIVAGLLIVVAVVVMFVSGGVGKQVFESPELRFVSGTEYNTGEQGQVIVEARFSNGTTALQTCAAYIWYPDKTVFMPGLNMTMGPNGNAYVNFTVPNTTGIYEYQAQCVLVNNKTGITSKSFHVSEFQNDTATKLNRVRAVIVK